MATIIDGKQMATTIKKELAQTIAEKLLKPCLAVVLVGADPASLVYVKNKKRGCKETGIESLSYALPQETTQAQLLDLVQELNNNKSVTGILVQLPLPSHLNPQEVLQAIDPKKDVDGFHPLNMGLMQIGAPCLLPCTPWGIVTMLKRSNIAICGKHCVVVGRSNIVGKPVAALLLQENATVTICHSKTQNLAEITKQADILVAAVGIPNFITGNMLKQGVVVVDVGIHTQQNGKLCGDVLFCEAEPIASAITPVPGGVGPMTIAMLLSNCVNACLNKNV